MPDPPTPPTMKRYTDYKDSGTNWLGEVPAHWRVTRIKDVFRSFGSGTTPISSETSYYDDGSINWLNTADLNNWIVFETKRKVTPKALAETSLKVYPKGSLAIAMYGQGETRGNVGLLAIEAACNQAALVMYQTYNAAPKFMLWWFISRKSNIRQINSGATQPNMNQDFVRNLLIALPPLPEQQAIADYLDAKTAQIDRKLDLLTQKAAKYRQLKQAIINTAVTRGLDQSVPMKDSEVEWIGEVPAHWTVCRVKDELRSLDHKRVPLSGEVRQEMATPQYDYYGASGVIDRVDDFIFDEPLILIGEDGANLLLRNSALAFVARGKYWVNNHAHVLKPYRGDLHYFCYLLESMDYTTLVSGSAQPKLTAGALANIVLVVPPLTEQATIATYLDDKATQIDDIVEIIEAQITKLKDLRKSLINDVVTGKLRVT